MENVTVEQVRSFRLQAHHLDNWYHKTDLARIAGACGLQNSPPGTWEIAMQNRIQDIRQHDMRQMLEVEKVLLQAWSFRGAPVIFPTAESDVFLSALIARPGEPWLYTQGIQLALDALQMSFDDVLNLVLQVMPKLDGGVLRSKILLDQTLAEWVLELLPADKRSLWNKPSLYGNPAQQTVGGAVISFLLRPCACLGLVVFGKREGTSPTFTSYQNWIGHPLQENGNPEPKLVRKYLHCYGPASVGGFMTWLGCSPAQASRMWQTVNDEIEPVLLSGKIRYILAEDRAQLLSPPQPERQMHLLGGHDPYLGLPDREVILDDRTRQKQIWPAVSSPGAVLWQGRIAGLWKSNRKGNGVDVAIALWDSEKIIKKDVVDLADRHASFRQLKLNRITLM